MGNKNVVVGLVVLMLYLSMSFFIERTSAMHQFHEKAAAVVVDTKGSSSLLDHQVVDVKRGPAYRKGGVFFTNYYPASYVCVPNSVREAGYNMRWYAWWFALFNIVVGIIVGIQKQANPRLRTWASWLAIVGVLLYPLRDTISFWGRYLNPQFSAGVIAPVLYPLMVIGGTAIGVALLLSLMVFVQGARLASPN